MTKHTRNFRPPFDPSREFVASRPLPVSGAELGSGDVFPKTAVSTRRLRQLFEQRAIRYAPGQEPTAGDLRAPRARLARPGAIGPQDLEHPGADGQPRRVPRLRARRQRSPQVTR